MSAGRVLTGAISVLGVSVWLTTNAYGASCPAVPRPPLTFYVSTAGSETNSGLAPNAAFRNIQTGVNCLFVPGDRLRIFPGVYTEFITVSAKNGAPGTPIVIEGLPGIAPGPAVTIQGTITGLGGSGHTFQFHTGSSAAPNNEWVRVGNGGEYESRLALPPQTSDWSVDQGAFIDPLNGRHTRLITYHRVEDLRASNETFEKIVDGCPAQDPRPGPTVGPAPNGCTERRPWVYMGPGLWFDTVSKKVHVRLSPTHNGVPGLADYAGETDPNRLALSIADKNMTTLKVDASTNVQLKNLAIKFSSVTLTVRNSSGIGFDGVNVSAGRFGARIGGSSGLSFSHCGFDGGLPTWMFRSDIKDGYAFLQGGQTLDDFLGKQTMETLIGMEVVSSVDIHNCEFTNAHDLYLQAGGVTFHHNWISNLNDDSLFLDGASKANGAVHHNVIERALSVFSFAGDDATGPWRIFRNLVDMRVPTAGIRPLNASFDRAYVWRVGAPFKPGNTPEGSYDIFQNTFVVPYFAEMQDGHLAYPQASFTHLRNALTPVQPRSSLNNVFVVLNRVSNHDSVLAHMLTLPTPQTTININGDLFYRRGFGSQVFATPKPTPPGQFDIFTCTPPADCLAAWHLTAFFQNSGTPGYEGNGVLLKDPQFNSWVGEPAAADDFRLKAGSPARAAGVSLPPALKAMDVDAGGIVVPDIGAYQTSPTAGVAPKLQVGIRGQRAYPPTAGP